MNFRRLARSAIFDDFASIFVRRVRPQRKSCQLRNFGLALLFLTLFLSGISGIVNQIVWQRSLKVFLGGSETLSSMTVVLVFMLGLGAGSFFAAKRAARFRNPAAAFAFVEVALFLVNLLIAVILSLDISQTIYTFQSFTVSIGIPLRVLYVVGAVMLLGIPCFLMGITMPLASEVCQRQLHWEESRLLGQLFVVNTGGAVLGAAASGFYLVPYHGQLMALIVAAACNGIAASAAGILVWRSHGVSSGVADAESHIASVDTVYAMRSRFITNEELLGFVTGFLALGYEMYLFRLNTIIWTPVPYTFAATLCGFLFFWSLGIHLSAKWKMDWVLVSLASAVLIASTPFLYNFHRWETPTQSVGVVLGIVYFLPCLGFGIIYGHLVASNASSHSASEPTVGSRLPHVASELKERHTGSRNRDWGRDVGRFYALNTIGSCVGILFFTLVGYEFDQKYNAWIITIGLLLIVFHAAALQSHRQHESAVLFRFVQTALLGVVIVLGVEASSVAFTVQSNGIRSYFGRDGVVEITPDGMMMWDGMEHSYLARNGAHIGDNNWVMATIPVLCHSGQDVNDVLVIGLGCGVTASTMSLLESVNQVDVYDINHTLQPFLKDYRVETLDVLSNPRVHLIWQDARSGLALNPKKYDIITQQPLYLKQAGSSILLSREYMQLVRSRLKPDGIFCIYSNSFGNQSQNLVVRQTVRSVFKFCASFKSEYMLVASDSPIDVNRFSWNFKSNQDGTFFAQIRLYESLVRRAGPDSGYAPLAEFYDDYPITWQFTDDVISDNHPIVEYPDVVKRLVPIAGVTPTPVAN